jgi:DNA (cytosine-5)-methyltransferase 1
MKQRIVARDFDFIWASPPCQHYTQMLNHGLTPRSNHADLIGQTRKILASTRLPYVIENVAGAPLNGAIMLCGTMFGLQTLRHRFFECSFPATAPAHPKHNGKGIRNQRDGGKYYRVYGHETGKRKWPMAMGIDWMKTPELAQAIPPAYSQYIAEQWSTE